jgi:hypothetical protein
MTVTLVRDSVIALEGCCPIEDAEPLLRHLLANPNATVDWRRCESAHTSLVQILLVSRAKLRGPPGGGFLMKHVEPLLVGPDRDRI